MRFTRLSAGIAALLLAAAPVAAHAGGQSESTGDGIGDDENSAAVAHTQASSDGEATANAVETNGEPLSEEYGTSESNTSGAAVDTAAQEGGSDAPGRAAVAPWSTESDTGQTSAYAALLALTFSPDGEVAHLELVRSESTAGSEEAAASTDAAVLRLGGDQLTVTVLHAEQSSGSDGVVYLVGVNEEQIASGADADGQCVVEVPGALTVNCLNVSAASEQAKTFVATADAADGAFAAEVANVESTFTADAGAAAPGEAVPSPDGSGGFDDSFAQPAADTGSELPRTGLAATALAVIGLGAIAAGLMSNRAGQSLRTREVITR